MNKATKTLQVRIDPKLHRALKLAAINSDKSIACVVQATLSADHSISKFLEEQASVRERIEDSPGSDELEIRITEHSDEESPVDVGPGTSGDEESLEHLEHNPSTVESESDQLGE